MIKRAIGIFLAFTGFVAAVVAVLDASDPIRTIALWSLVGSVVVLLCIVVGPEVLRSYRARKSLPPVSALEDRCGAYQVDQATRSEVAWIARLEASVYSREDAIPERILREWYTANASGFSIIRGPSGKPIGHLDILPLRPATLDAFCKGQIVEKDIRGDSLFSERERNLITVLYVESIILRPDKPLTTASAMICVLKNLSAILRRVAAPTLVEKVYAIAATSAGERLMRKLGFEPEGSSEHRRDHHNLFVVRFSDLLIEAAKFVGDQSLRLPGIEAGL